MHEVKESRYRGVCITLDNGYVAKYIALNVYARYDFTKLINSPMSEK